MKAVFLVIICAVSLAGIASSAWSQPTLAQQLASAHGSEAHPLGFEGRWGLVGTGCASRGDLVPIEITSTEIRFYESRCPIAEVDPVGQSGGTWTVTVECSGEGETWTVPYVFALLDAGQDRQLVMIDMSDGFASLRGACH